MHLCRFYPAITSTSSYNHRNKQPILLCNSDITPDETAVEIFETSMQRKYSNIGDLRQRSPNTVIREVLQVVVNQSEFSLQNTISWILVG